MIRNNILGSEGTRALTSLAATTAMVGAGIPSLIAAGLAAGGVMLHPLMGGQAWAPVVRFLTELPQGPMPFILILVTIPVLLLVLASLWNRCEAEKGGPTRLARKINRCWTPSFAPTTPDESRRIHDSTCITRARFVWCPIQDTLVFSTGITTVARPLE